MLGDGPLHHLRRAAAHERVSHHALRRNVEPKPLVNLRRVVRARDIVKQETSRDNVTLSSILAQVGEYDMAS